jgi:hypothetical protein
MNNCTFGALTAAVITGLLMSLVIPSNPEKPFIQENTALRADNSMLTKKLIDMAQAQVAEEKKRTEAALKSCQK